jgi:hypothetical protein
MKRATLTANVNFRSPDEDLRFQVYIASPEGHRPGLMTEPEEQGNLELLGSMRYYEDAVNLVERHLPRVSHEVVLFILGDGKITHVINGKYSKD